MTESPLTQKFRKKATRRLPRAVIIKHADNYTAGVPDMTLTLNGRTSWLEFKHVTKRGQIVSKGIQNLTAQKLALEGTCWYIVYESVVEGQFWYIVEPSKVFEYDTKATASGPNHDHDAIVEWVAKLHGAEPGPR